MAAYQWAIVGAFILLAIGCVFNVIDVLGSNCPHLEAHQVLSSCPARKDVVSCRIEQILRLGTHISLMVISVFLNLFYPAIRDSSAETAVKSQIIAMVLITLLSGMAFYSPPTNYYGITLWIFVVLWAWMTDLIYRMRMDLDLLMAAVVIMEGYIFDLGRHNLLNLLLLVLPTGLYIMLKCLSAELKQVLPSLNGTNKEGIPLREVRGVEVPCSVISDSTEQTLSQLREEARKLAIMVRLHHERSNYQDCYESAAQLCFIYLCLVSKMEGGQDS